MAAAGDEIKVLGSTSEPLGATSWSGRRSGQPAATRPTTRRRDPVNNPTVIGRGATGPALEFFGPSPRTR